MIADGGSIQNIREIPVDLKALYKTVWEISQKTLINMAADRGAFIDQSQSFNIHMPDPSFARLDAFARGMIWGMHVAERCADLRTDSHELQHFGLPFVTAP